MCIKNHNIWCMVPEIWSETDRIICHFGPFFALLPPPLIIPKIKFWKKMKKMPIDIILLYIHVYHEDHIYGSWNIRCDRHKFSSFWVIFCLFSPLTIWKIKILTLKKTPGDIIVLHICTINDKNTWCMVPKIWSATDIIFCHSEPFFALLPPYKKSTQKIKILKTWKNHLELLSHYTSVP